MTTTITKFLQSEKIPYHHIWYYLKDGKKMPIGEKNNTQLEDIAKIMRKNKPNSIFKKSKDPSKKYDEIPLTKEEKESLKETFTVFMKYTENYYCVDVDDPTINSMQDFIEKTGCNIFENSSWVKGNTKGIHIYVKVNNAPTFSNQQNVFKLFYGDFIRINNMWERTDKMVENYNANNTVFNWETFKDVFEIERLNQGTVKKSKKIIVKSKTEKSTTSTASSITTTETVEERNDDHNEATEEIKAVAELISLEHIDTYGTWISFLHAFKSKGYYDLAKTISQKSATTWDEEAFDDKWDSIKDTEKISLGTIHHYAKLSNPKEYARIMMPDLSSTDDSPDFTKAKEQNDKYDKMMTQNLYTPAFTSGLIADFFKLIYEDKFVCVNDVVYCYNGIYWEQEDKRNSNLSKFFDKVFVKDLLQYANGKMAFFTAQLNNDNYNQETVKATITNISNLIKNILFLRNNGQRQLMISDIITFMTNNKIEFDKKPFLIAFENGVYDLVQQKIVPSKFDDWISKTTGYNYVASTPDQRTTLNALLDTIFPNPEIKEDNLICLSTGLCGIQQENIIIDTGVGGNGKSLLNGLMLKTVGGYGYTLQSSILVSDLKEGANPAVANLHNMRFALVQEPNSDRRINCSVAKELTGNQTLNVRGLYQTKCGINLCLTLFMECNDMPLLNEVNPAMQRRLRVSLFESKFVDKETYNSIAENARPKNLFIANPKYKTKEWQDEYKCALFDILCEKFKVFYENGLVFGAMPKACADKCKDYLATSDNIFGWFNEHYEKLGNEAIPLTKIYETFKATEYFMNMSKNDKRKYNRKYFVEKLETNLFLKKDIMVKGTTFNKKLNNADCIVGWRKRIDENDNPDLDGDD